MKRSGKHSARLLLVLFLAFGLALPLAGSAFGEVTKEELTGLYNKVREAIIKEDLATFEKLVLPPKPDVPKMTPKDMAEAKGFVDDILPDLDKVKFIKFEQNDQEALFVLQTYLEDKENITLSSFRFRKKDGKWMLFAKFMSNSFSVENPQADEENIKKVLDNNSGFKLQSEEEQAAQEKSSAQAAAAPAGQTGSGSLTVAGNVYNFGHAFAFRKKALGYDDKIEFHVVLTEEAVPVEKVKTQLREKDDWSDFVNNLVLVFDSEMKPDYNSFWVRHESTNHGGPTSDTQGGASLEGERIKGSLKMDKPKKVFGDTFVYDVTFDAPIISK